MFQENESRNSELYSKLNLQLQDTKTLFKNYRSSSDKLRKIIRSILKERGYNNSEIDELTKK